MPSVLKNTRQKLTVLCPDYQLSLRSKALKSGANTKPLKPHPPNQPSQFEDHINIRILEVVSTRADCFKWQDEHRNCKYQIRDCAEARDDVRPHRRALTANVS